MFRAYDPERDRLVAVKLFRLDLPPERTHRLIAEFERLIAADLSHAAIATPLATGIAGACAYIATHYVAGDSLDVVLREFGPAPPGEVLRVATELAEALDVAAAAHVSHGALHPRDVLVSQDEVRVTGLGVARALEWVGFAPPLRRPYTAPERVAGGTWDHRADIFSLAAVAHELLWARRPAGTGAHAADALKPLDGGDLGALRDLFRRALAENPNDRFRTASEFAKRLRAALPSVADSRQTSGIGREPRLPLEAPDPLVLTTLAASRALDGPSTRSASANAGRPVEPETELAIHATTAPDLELHVAEEARYRDVEVERAAAVAPVEMEPTAQPTPEPAVADGQLPAPKPVEPWRSATWPLALALLLGSALGFAGGYAVGIRDRVGSTSGVQEFTEATVGEADRGIRGKEPIRLKPEATRALKPEATRALKPEAAGGRKPEAAGARKPDVAKALTSEARVGRLLVRSTPSGARVFVDGTDRGLTPAAIRDLPRGAHRVRIVRNGYDPEERRVDLTPSHPAQSLSIALVASRGVPPATSARTTAASTGRPVGALSVESRPAGAKVYVDGRLVGTTPLSLPDVSVGEHAVRIERDGYRLWSSSVHVVTNERNRMTASLER